MEIVRSELGPDVNANNAVLPKGATPERRVSISQVMLSQCDFLMILRVVQLE